MFILGKLEQVYESGTEQDGSKRFAAEVLDASESSNGRRNRYTLYVSKSEVAAFNGLLEQDVLVEFDTIEGVSVKNGARYSFRANGRIASARALDAINTAALAYA